MLSTLALYGAGGEKTLFLRASVEYWKTLWACECNSARTDMSSVSLSRCHMRLTKGQERVDYLQGRSQGNIGYLMPFKVT